VSTTRKNAGRSSLLTHPRAAVSSQVMLPSVKIQCQTDSWQPPYARKAEAAKWRCRPRCQARPSTSRGVKHPGHRTARRSRHAVRTQGTLSRRVRHLPPAAPTISAAPAICAFLVKPDAELLPEWIAVTKIRPYGKAESLDVVRSRPSAIPETPLPRENPVTSASASDF